MRIHGSFIQKECILSHLAPLVEGRVQSLPVRVQGESLARIATNSFYLLLYIGTSLEIVKFDIESMGIIIISSFFTLYIVAE